ncbi:hypothetical protein HY837_04780 [archaeon]|nr:hypothetical protein [archaeon]
MIDLDKLLEKDCIIISGELSYVGRNWSGLVKDFNKKFENEWSHCWFFDGELKDWWDVLDLYEEGYYEFLKSNPEVRNWLVNTASEVYDLAPSNVKSGIDYAVQECEAMHYQDISIRRVLTRLNLEELFNEKWTNPGLPEIKVFNGDHLVQVRGPESEGFILNPGKVPFHKPEMIPKNSNGKSWWDENSIEDFYQRTKILLVNAEKFKTQLFAVGENSCFLRYSKQKYYRTTLENPYFLTCLKGDAARKQAKEEGCLIVESPKMSYTRIKSILTGLNTVQ